jgi:hypothetical protein
MIKSLSKTGAIAAGGLSASQHLRNQPDFAQEMSVGEIVWNLNGSYDYIFTAKQLCTIPLSHNLNVSAPDPSSCQKSLEFVRQSENLHITSFHRQSAPTHLRTPHSVPADILSRRLLTHPPLNSLHNFSFHFHPLTRKSSSIESIRLFNIPMTSQGIARYERQVKFGEGSYGIVYKALDTTTGSTVALKILKFDEFDEDGVPSTLLREISILKTINHINIVSLIDVCTVTIPASLAFEYIDTDLARLIAHRGRVFKPSVVKSYAFQMTAGLYYLHWHRRRPAAWQEFSTNCNTRSPVFPTFQNWTEDYGRHWKSD